MRVLLSVDGSPLSHHAMQTLKQLAPLEELLLVHVMELPALDHPMVTPDMRDKVVAEVEAQLRPLSEKLLAEMESAAPQDCARVERLLRSGYPAEVVLEIAEARRPDVLVLGSRGLGAIKELVLGSVSHRVVMNAPCSTLVVKQAIPAIRKVLMPVPVDAPDDVEPLVEFLKLHPFREPVEITVMTVWPQPQLPWPITLGQSTLLEERAVENARKEVEALVGRLTDLGYPSSASVGLGSPTCAILEEQRAGQYDLIMMGSHHRKGIARFVLGSVSHAVLHQADCGVLIVR